MQKNTATIIIILLLAVIAFLLYNNYSNKRNISSTNSTPATNKTVIDVAPSNSIDELTKESVVVTYFKKNGKLPVYYITKRQAREHGWNPAAGNLCEVLPGKAIGGDVFTNREGSLPAKSGRIWYEADLNYSCMHRNADRLLFSNDGLIFVTNDHYKTFIQK
jgi:hypothetical protein